MTGNNPTPSREHRAAPVVRVKGVHDLLPEVTVSWHYLESVAQRVFSRYGYREVRTPVFEKTELFSRAVGTTSDIVEKEMYTFADRNGTSLSLRPEGTASVVRAFIENSLHRHLPWRVWYRGPMFRYERPQKGRQRQFHQIGCELFGPEGPLADAEVMAMVLRFLREIGVDGTLTLEINSLGCSVCRPDYRQRLTGYLEGAGEQVCGDCQRRLVRNPLRVLDCKVPGCREIARGAPLMKEHLCSGCAAHFKGLTNHLNALGLPFLINPLMVRGLDYYNRTAFEVTTTALGAQNAVAAGGRYDTLVAKMGGTATPAIGFAMGMERLVLLLDRERAAEPPPDLYLVAAGETARGPGLAMAEQLRAVGWPVLLDLSGGSMKSQMKRAGRSGAPLVVIIGEQEAEQKQVIIKTMVDGQQQTVDREEVVDRLRSRLMDR